MAKSNLAPKGRRRHDAASRRRRSAASAAAPRTAPLELDRLIHERMRLAIVSALAVNEALSFNELKRLLETTDGNLSVHARKLEEADYIVCTKSFEGRVPRTEYRLSAAGRRALERYLDAHGSADPRDPRALSAALFFEERLYDSKALRSRRPAGLHVGIIMDGNGRWATRQGRSRSAGHRAGAAMVRRIVEAAPDCGHRRAHALRLLGRQLAPARRPRSAG